MEERRLGAAHIGNCFGVIAALLCAGEQLVSRVFKGRYNDTAFEPVALRRLSLAFNELHTINKNAFEHLVHLRWLDLSGNRFRILDQLTALSFRNLPSLQYMDLSDNELIFLNTSCFVGLNNLQVLDLSNNALDFIPVTIKDVAGTLRILKIDNNPIVEISEDSLLGMEALEEFQASNLSQIEEIKTNSFTTLKRLRRVDLSHIGSKGVIYNQAFGDSLREMNLSNSNMEILSDELVNWSRLTVLDLRGNQLYCTCVLYNISTQLSAEVKRDADAPYCFDYKRYKQYKMYELSEDICREQDEYLNLSGGMYSTERIMRMVLLSTSVLLIICVCIAVWLGYVRCYKNQRSYPFSTAVLYNPVSN